MSRSAFFALDDFRIWLMIVQMMRSYSTASGTLKELLKAPELQKENVETTMDNLSELMADQKEVEAVIQSGGREAVDVDEDELEKELAGLVDEKKQTEERERERLLMQDKAPQEVGGLDKKLDTNIMQKQAQPAV